MFQGGIPAHLTSRPDGQEGQSVSSGQSQVINVHLDDRGLSFEASHDQDVQFSRIVDFDRRTSASPLVSDGGVASLDGSTVFSNPPYSSCIDSRPLAVEDYDQIDLKSCIAQILQQQNGVSASSHLVASTLSSSRGSSIAAAAASIQAKPSLGLLRGPRAILPCNPQSHSSLTRVVPGAITRPTGLVIPLGYSMPGTFVSVTGRLPPRLAPRLPISAAVCNSQLTKPNCVELTNVALANMAFSNTALTSITSLASTLPVKVTMGCAASATLASTNLTSASLASMNLVLNNVTCPNLSAAATNVAFGNSSSLRQALTGMSSVNLTPANVASVNVVPLSVASTSMTSSVNTAVANMTLGNVACGNTIIFTHPTGVGQPAMKITRLNHILARNHGPPLLIAQTRSGMPSTIVSTRLSPTDYPHKTQPTTTVQSPSLNMTKHCITSPHPLTLTDAPTSDILHMAWNQRNDDWNESVSSVAVSGANVVSAVTTASNVSPTSFFSMVDGSNVVV